MHALPHQVLPTAKVMARARNGTDTMMRVLFDTGSSINCVRVSAAEKLKVTNLEINRPLTLHTLAGTDDSMKNYIEIYLLSPGGAKIPVHCYVMREFVKLPCVDVSEDEIHSYYPDVLLNERYPRPVVEIDILLGIQHTVMLMGRYRRPLTRELILTSTMWGSTL